MRGDSRTILTIAGAVLALGGCPSEVPTDDDDSTGLTFAGTLVDIDRGDPLEDCSVGETLDGAVQSGADGRFELELSAEETTVHIKCSGGVLRSFRLPPGTSFDWEIGVDMGTGPDLEVECLPTISGDAEPTGLAAGEGRMELRVLTDSATGAWTTNLPSAGWTVNITSFLRVPQGPYLAIGKAHSGSIPGFAISETQTCDGNGSAPNVDLELQAMTTTSLSGSWSPASGADYTFAASQPLSGVDAKFQWYDYDVVHTSTADGSTWELELIDGIGTGTPEVAACQAASDGRSTCLIRRDITDGADLGAMPEFVSLATNMNGEDMVITPVGAVDSGSTLIHLTTDLADPMWTGWTPGAGSEYEIDVPAEWITDLPDPTTLYGFGRGERDVTHDFATGFEATDRPDGWSLFRMPSAPAF